MGEQVSIELDSESIAAAKEAGIDLSQLLRDALCRRLPHLHGTDQQTASQQWYQDNKEAVDSYNKFIENYGLFSDGSRTF